MPALPPIAVEVRPRNVSSQRTKKQCNSIHLQCDFRPRWSGEVETPPRCYEFRHLNSHCQTYFERFECMYVEVE